jgi:hypothetical protein
MNKPITMRVRQATNGNKGVQEPLLDVGAAGVRGGAATRKQPSPLKKTDGDIKGEKSYGPGLGNMFDGVTSLETPSMPTFEPYSATNTIANADDATNVADDKKDTETKKDSKDSGLAEGAANVAGTSKKIPRATDAKTEGPPKSESKRSSRTIGDAFQDNMVARIDKAGELGRARREARRNKKAGISESEASSASSASSAEKIARDKRVDGVISRNTPSTSTTASSTDPSDELLNKIDTEGGLGAPVQMRMNANIGIKSKSPMKKGYFKGM